MEKQSHWLDVEEEPVEEIIEEFLKYNERYVEMEDENQGRKYNHNEISPSRKLIIIVCVVIIIIAIGYFAWWDLNQNNNSDGNETVETPSHMRIFVINYCNYDVNFEIKVNDASYGTYYLQADTGFFSDNAEFVYTNVVPGYTIEVYVISSTHMVKTPPINAPTELTLYLHQDGSMTYSI